jgi:hypothetical protein
MKCLLLCSLFWMVAQHQSATAIKGTTPAVDATAALNVNGLWPSIRWSLPPSPIRFPSIRYTLPPAIRFPTVRTLPPAVFPNVRTLPPAVFPNIRTLPPVIRTLPPAILRTPPPVINPWWEEIGDPVEANIGAIAKNAGPLGVGQFNTALRSSHCGCDACTCCCVTSTCDCCGKCDSSTLNANINIAAVSTEPAAPSPLGLFASAAVQHGVAIG